ncbi:MAG: TIGR00282 family metallophosphoesterase [Planctomycetota bacterium]|nr:TIGR00282 family metallophosphoesterase [Planctomycetota bacterium]
MPADSSATRILLIGDIVGRPGRRIVQEMLPGLRDSLNLDLVIANAENSAAGSGITPKIFAELLAAGVDLMTLGDHAWKRRDNLEVLEKEPLCLRPHNYPDEALGTGWAVVETAGGVKVAHIIVLGRVFMDSVACPFRTVDAVLQEIPEEVKIRIVEFHAEATSEKQAAGWHFDGRVSAVVGTHTHVMTADARILPGGTGYLSDMGMTGPYDGVIGRDSRPVLHKFLTSMHAPFTVAENNAHLCGVLLTVDPTSGKPTSFRSVDIAEAPEGAFFHDVIEGPDLTI